MVHDCWKPIFDKYQINVDEIYASENNIFPSKEQIFKVFEMDVREIQIVLLGQDPYHKPGQAHGLSFSVPIGFPIPPSLRNIYKELKREFPERKYEFLSGNLENWFYREKIFLLNASLTVIQNKPGSQMKVWRDFTNNIIEFISIQNKECIFLLLGNFAKEKDNFIENKNRIVYGVHPSPLSASRGFFDSGIFINIEKKCNRQIDWSV